MGLAFRNEISPKNGLLRVREFMQAEIEYFVNPEDKSHPNFMDVRDLQLPLWSKEAQKKDGPVERISVGTAVETGVINNETLG